MEKHLEESLILLLMYRVLSVLMQSWSFLIGAAIPLASGVSAPIRQLRLQDSPRRSGREQGRGGNSSFARAGELYLALGVSALLSPHHAACAGGTGAVPGSAWCCLSLLSFLALGVIWLRISGTREGLEAGAS